MISLSYDIISRIRVTVVLDTFVWEATYLRWNEVGQQSYRIVVWYAADILLRNYSSRKNVATRADIPSFP